MFGFLAVVQRTIQETDKKIVEMLTEAKSGLDQTSLMSVRHFLRQDGNVFLRRIDALFRTNLERAMQTMYVDMRPGMRKLSVDELSLIDDEVVTHQIEVGRLTERMRAANEESIGRLNVIVAQLHGQREPRERENPFRPYLLARALYEAIRETAGDEARAKVLFEHLSNVLTQHLPGYYSSIREVFEASGVRGKFQAQRSRARHNQRYFGAPLGDEQAIAAQMSARLMPGFQRMLETMHGMSNGMASNGTASVGEDKGHASVQDFIRKVFTSSKSFMVSNGDGLGENGTTAEANPLVAQLNRFQKVESGGQATSAANGAAKNRLPELREKMDLSTASVTERMTIDVVSMLFEFILDDDQIPENVRRHIARLQIPVLKAAVLEPDLLHDERHPARQLLNRLSTAAVGSDPATPAGQELGARIERVVNRVLAEFNADASVLAACLHEFEEFLANFLKQDDQHTAHAIEAVESAEKFSVLLSNTTTSLCDVLLPLNIDKRISDFIIMVWPHVLVRASWHDAESQAASGQPSNLYPQFHAVLSDLLWSIQEKNASDRAVLMRLLPDLVKRLRKALQLIQLPEEESKQILDVLMEIHTQILRTNPNNEAAAPGLDDLQREFSRVVVNWERASWGQDEPPQVRESMVEEIFAQHAVTASLNLGVNTQASSSADREFLFQTYLLGTRVAFRSPDGSNIAGQLVWVSTHRSLYLFKHDRNGALALYTPAALLEALAEESIVPVEYAPVFERAVESLLFGASTLQSAA